jgi:pimeloyl-ACP methyl ester carboxylesterase
LADFVADTGLTELHGSDTETASDGPPCVLLHGLTATRRYVVMGSRALERAGFRVITYDARGHGQSSAAPHPGAYEYEDLADDLLAVLDDRGIDRAVLSGSSMGAHTIITFALAHPQRVSGCCLATPAYLPGKEADAGLLERWDALSDGLRDGGVDGFLAAYGDPPVPENWKPTLLQVLRQRLSSHERPASVADALRAVPRSAPFAALEDLAALGAVPVAVVGDRDEPDPDHPLAVAEAYASAIPGAELHVEAEGESPIPWQGGRLSKVIHAVSERAAA